MYQAPMSLKEIIVNRLRNYFFLNIMQHPKTKNFVRKSDVLLRLSLAGLVAVQFFGKFGQQIRGIEFLACRVAHFLP